VETRALAPEATYEQLRAALDSCARFSSIALVGHEPSIGQLAARLAGMKPPLEFKKGAVCRIDLDTLPPSGPGRLRWFITAKMLARLGR
jgi:phosphohistidine phosphatase